MAPAMPFYAEYLWQAVKHDTDAESVHLAKWPEVVECDNTVIADMANTRLLVTDALDLRVKANIKVRQPLAALTIKRFAENERYIISIENQTACLELVKQETNVHQVLVDENLKTPLVLDTIITPELKAEGAVREFIRAVQDMRKKAGLEQPDRIQLNIHTSAEGESLLGQFDEEIRRVVGAESISFSDATGIEIQAGDLSFVVEIVK
jgi:isoleucyl-tRNA synthetase